MYQHIVMAHAATLTHPFAPSDPPPGTGGDSGSRVLDGPGGDFSISRASLDWTGIFGFLGVVSFVLLVVFALGIMAKPRKTSLGDAGKASGVMGIGLGWLGVALVLGAGTLVGLLGGFVASIVNK